MAPLKAAANPIDACMHANLIDPVGMHNRSIFTINQTLFTCLKISHCYTPTDARDHTENTATLLCLPQMTLY